MFMSDAEKELEKRVSISCTFSLIKHVNKAMTKPLLTECEHLFSKRSKSDQLLFVYMHRHRNSPLK